MIAIQYLDWDTNFFGFPTARILPAGLAQDQLSVYCVNCGQWHAAGLLEHAIRSAL
jgi:hypothetical protein